MILRSLTRFRDFGLLLFRLGFGLSFVYAWGWAKMTAGPKGWTKLGEAMKVVGIDFLPVFWGFMGAFSECVGCALFALGFLFRPACMLMCCTMGVAIMVNLNGDGFPKAWQAIHYALIFFCFLFIGPGRYSVDRT